MRLDELHSWLPRAGRINGAKFRALCPVHGGRAESLVVSQRADGSLLVHCHAGCRTEHVLESIGLRMRDLFPGCRGTAAPVVPLVACQAPAGDADRRRRIQLRAAATWREARPLDDGPAVEYLLGRGCRIPPKEGDLRWHPDVRLYGFCGPALVGRISRADDALQGLGLHLTWLERVGNGWRRTERRYLGSKAGGVVRLWPDEAVTLGLGIAEGIETTLAAAHALEPVWACLDAGNLGTFSVLPGIESLTVFGDNDVSGVGQRAAMAAAQRWADAGRKAAVVMADCVGQDIADEVNA
jgi:putative DNA primase/helicase